MCQPCPALGVESVGKMFLGKRGKHGLGLPSEEPGTTGLVLPETAKLFLPNLPDSTPRK